MTHDRFLVSVVESAQRGERCPPLRLVTTGGERVVGTPAPAEDFVDAMRGPLATEIGRGRRQRGSGPVFASSDEVDEVLAALGQHACESEPVLTIVPARLFWSGNEDGVHVAGLRVPLHAVSAWWIAGGEEIKAPAKWGIGFGVIAPIGE